MLQSGNQPETATLTSGSPKLTLILDCSEYILLILLDLLLLLFRWYFISLSSNINKYIYLYIYLCVYVFLYLTASPFWKTLEWRSQKVFIIVKVIFLGNKIKQSINLQYPTNFKKKLISKLAFHGYC